MKVEELMVLVNKCNEGLFYYKILKRYDNFAHYVKTNDIIDTETCNEATKLVLFCIRDAFSDLEDLYVACKEHDYAKNFIRKLGEKQKAQTQVLICDNAKYTYPEDEQMYFDHIRKLVQSDIDIFTIFHDIGDKLAGLYLMPTSYNRPFISDMINICISLMIDIKNKAEQCLEDL